MIVKSNIYDDYVGPRALFDPNYIPPKILFRKKEEYALFSILDDSFSDNFCFNILYQGLQGIGKKVIVNKVLRDLCIKHQGNIEFNKLMVDCKEKNLEELIGSLLAETSKNIKMNFKPNLILNSKISDLWNLLKLAIKKIDNSIILILNNTDNLRPDVFRKLLQFGKESNITIISTVNKVLRTSTLDVLGDFDLRKKLNYFTYKELLNILRQRVSLSFQHQIDKELMEFLTDLIFEHYVPVPGKGIDILREIYPLLKNQESIEPKEMLELCQVQFDNAQIIDEFSMLTYISEEDLLTILFLDNVSDFFLNKAQNFYINYKQLKELYDVSCESLEYDKDVSEFKLILRKLQNVGILSKSRRTKSEKDSALNYYFMIINPTQLKAIVDTIFIKF